MPFLALNNQSYRLLVAEFFVIVLGVLVAFQVEEWRQEREERQIEEASLRLMLADFDTGRNEYQNLIDAGNRQKEQAAIMLGFMLDPATLSKDVNDIPSVDLGGRLWQPTSAAFDSLRDSGRLGLISNPALQSALLYHFDLTEPYFLEQRLGHTSLANSARRAIESAVFVRPRPDYLESGETDRVMLVTIEEFVNDQGLLEALISLEGNRTDRLLSLAQANIERLDRIEAILLTHLETL